MTTEKSQNGLTAKTVKLELELPVWLALKLERLSGNKDCSETVNKILEGVVIPNHTHASL